MPGTLDSAAVDNPGGRPEGVQRAERTEEDLYDYALKANRTHVK